MKKRLPTHAALPAVSVVLCTYNGATYLPELLASLAAQSIQIDRLVLRDDGSNDDSVTIARSWAERCRIKFLLVREPDLRLGPARSFLTALAAAGPAEVHLLADQDDVWLPTKVERAVEAIRRVTSGPALYASRLQVVDASLRPLGAPPPAAGLSFAGAACESVLTGCTMAMNEELRLLAAREISDAVIMHDWWLYLLASAAGRIVFDHEPTLLYRQHGQNAIGAAGSGLSAWAVRLRLAVDGPSGGRRAQLREFGRIYQDVLPQEARRLVRLLTSDDSSWWIRWRTAWTAPIARRKWLDRIGTRVAIMRNRF